MPKNHAKRLAELERRLAATYKQVTEGQREAIWAQFSDEELRLANASLERRERPGYELTAEDEAIERRWHELVQMVVPEPQRAVSGRRAWAVEWGEAVRKHG